MTDPFTAVSNDAQIGSGPFKFVASEWKPGSEVVYVKNTEYVPRSEPPDAMAGGKMAKVDRLVFKVIPDANTSANALLKGEVDLLDMPAGDLLPLLEKDKEIVVQKVHPVGTFGFFRPNALHPPFNNPKARQALALIASQEDFLSAGFGDKKWWNTCYSYFVCKSIYGTEVGSESFRKPDPARAKKLLEEAGYKGEKIYAIGTREVPGIGAITEVYVDALRKIGVNVELEWMDWGTMVTRFGSNKNKPGEQGGWSLWAATGSWSTWHNPLTNLGTNMSKDTSWAGWASDEEVETYRNEFIQAQDKEKRMAALEKLHKRLWEVVPYVMTGQFDQAYAWRKNVTGVLPTSKLVLFNITKE
jgi:peptide/nickel transport system substrate-binding protein